MKTKMKASEKILKSDLVKIKSIRKRTGEVIPFDLNIIRRAILKAFEVTVEGEESESHVVTNSVFKSLLKLREEIVSKNKKAIFLPTVEMIQDLVEKELMKKSFPETAKKYILYRSKRSELRATFGHLSVTVR